MYIKVRNGFLREENNKLSFTNHPNEKVNIEIIYDSENTFKIKILDNKYMLKDLFIDEYGDSFRLEETNLFCNNELIYKNIHFLERTTTPLLETFKEYETFYYTEERKNISILIENLIKKGEISPNNTDNNGMTSIMLIFMYYNEFLKLLLKDKSLIQIIKNTLKIQDNRGINILINSCIYNNSYYLNFILDNKLIDLEDMFCQSNRGHTPLYYICYNDNVNILKKFIKNGLVNREVLKASSALSVIHWENSFNCLKLLLKHKLIDKEILELEDNRGKTTIETIYSCGYISGRCLKILLNDPTISEILINNQYILINDRFEFLNRGMKKIIFDYIKNNGKLNLYSKLLLLLRF